MQSIRFKDEIIEQVKEMEASTKQQQFNPDFLIMTEIFDGLFKDLLDSFLEKPVKDEKKRIELDNVVSMVKLA